MFFVLEKGFVRADDFGVFLEALADARAKADEAFDAIGRNERVAENLLRLLADAIHAARTLNEADDGPRQIEVHHDGGVLKVLTFAENVSGDQHAEFFGRRHVVGRAFVPRLVAFGAETAGIFGRLFNVAGHAGHQLEAARLQLFREVGHGVGELGEDENLLAGMLFCQEFLEFGQFVILVGLPLAREFENGEKPLGILTEMLGKVFDKNVGTQPVKIAGVLGAEQLVAGRAGSGEISKGFGGDFSGLAGGGFVRAKQGAVAVVVFGAGIEERGVLCADGQRQAILQRVEKDIIAQNVATHRKQERMAAAFKPLEQIRAAEADEAFARTREIRHHLGLFLCRAAYRAWV